MISYELCKICAPWLSWLQRPTVTSRQSEGREFEPHRGSSILFCNFLSFRFHGKLFCTPFP